MEYTKKVKQLNHHVNKISSSKYCMLLDFCEKANKKFRRISQNKHLGIDAKTYRSSEIKRVKMRRLRATIGLKKRNTGCLSSSTGNEISKEAIFLRFGLF
ncbi:unnamed protein product [Caenorhabditis brenneri]